MIINNNSLDCHHLFKGCTFNAPNVDIFKFAPLFTIYGINITKPILLVIIFTILLIVSITLLVRRLYIIPNKSQNIIELMYLFVRDRISRDNIKQTDGYMSFLLALFIFVWILNVMGSIPGIQFPISSHIAFPVGLALISWCIYMFVAIKKHKFNFLKALCVPPGMSPILYIILVPIEFLSNIIARPFTLAIRLYANMFAGHMLISTFALGTWYLFNLLPVGMLFSGMSFVATIAMFMFEFVIQALQAYIFTVLVASYIGASLADDH